MKVKSCLLAIGAEPRSDVTVGDRILVKRGDSHQEATVLKIVSPVLVTVRWAHSQSKLNSEVSLEEITALMIGD